MMLLYYIKFMILSTKISLYEFHINYAMSKVIPWIPREKLFLNSHEIRKHY